MGTNNNQPLSALITIISKERFFSTMRTSNTEFQAAVGTNYIILLDGRPAFGASQWANRIYFTTVRTDICIWWYQFTTVFTGMHISGHY